MDLEVSQDPIRPLSNRKTPETSVEPSGSPTIPVVSQQDRKTRAEVTKLEHEMGEAFEAPKAEDFSRLLRFLWLSLSVRMLVSEN